MRFRRSVLDLMAQRIVQMGLAQCPVCATGSLVVLPYPAVENIGGFHHEASDPRHDPEANVLFLVHVECQACGHVLLFNSERLEPSSSKALIQGLTEDEEEAWEREHGEGSTSPG